MSFGNVNQSDIVTITNNQVIRSGKQFSSFFGFVPLSETIDSQSIAIDPIEKSFINLSASSPITLASTPSILSGFDGQVLILRGSGSSTVTIQDKGSLVGSGVNLGGVNRTIGEADYLVLVYSEQTQEWEEIIYKDN